MNQKQIAKNETKKWIEQEYGRRCKVFTYFCPTCEMWITFDRLFARIEDEFEWMKKVSNYKADNHCEGRRK